MVTGVSWGQITAIMDKQGVEIYHVALTMRAHLEDGQWAAYCEELGVHSCGDTLDEAFENVADATIAYLNTIEALGERRAIFDERGVNPQLGVPGIDDDAKARVVPDEFVTRVYAGHALPVG